MIKDELKIGVELRCKKSFHWKDHYINKEYYVNKNLIYEIVEKDGDGVRFKTKNSYNNDVLFFYNEDKSCSEVKYIWDHFYIIKERNKRIKRLAKSFV